MRRFVAFRRIAALTLLIVILGLEAPRLHAADPQPYAVELKPTGDAELDGAVKDSSALVALGDKAAVGGFALVQRARDDAARFEEAARAFGYYNARVVITVGGQALDTPTLVDTIDNAPAAPPLPVTVAIDLGPPFRLGNVSVKGRLPEGFNPTLGLNKGQTARAADVVAAQELLVTGLREASYPFATVTLLPAVLHRDRLELDVSFQVATGPNSVLGPIRFNGLRAVSEAFMRRRLLLRPGMPFSPTKIEAARQDLLTLGVFSSVRVVAAEAAGAEGNVPLDIDVEERKPRAVDLGAAWSTDLGANLNLGWHHRNLFGGAEQLNLTAAAQLGGDATTKPGGQIGAQFIKPDFVRRDQSLEINLSAVKQSLVAYDQRALIERVSITRKLSPEWSIRAGVLGEQEGITQESVGRTYNLVGLPLSVKYDSTKNLLDPVSGMRGTVSVTPVASLGSPGGLYFITQISGSKYFDFGSEGRSVLALRALVGQVTGSGVFGMPPDQRLYAGGTGTVRGYRYQSIGPRFADGKPTGGTAVSAATVEIRQRFLEHWGAAAFVDIGQASGNGTPFSANWHAGAGAGVRYFTPIGPIRLDIAVPLHRQPGGDTLEVYIGIGQAF